MQVEKARQSRHATAVQACAAQAARLTPGGGAAASKKQHTW